MSKREWPFPGDTVLIRARKSALAYRQLAQDYAAERQELVDVLRLIDPRIAAWVEEQPFKTMYKNIQDGQYPGPDRVVELDERLYQWGEDWQVEGRPAVYDDEDQITAKEAGRILGVSANTVNTYRLRGRITGRYEKVAVGGNRWMYRAGDIYDLSREIRGRNSPGGDTTVTVPSSGESDAE